MADDRHLENCYIAIFQISSDLNTVV